MKGEEGTAVLSEASFQVRKRLSASEKRQVPKTLRGCEGKLPVR